MTIGQFLTLFAALCASALTTFGIIVVRGTKITEFRQKWIDDQRNDISQFLSLARIFSTETLDRSDDKLSLIGIALNRVKLRDNPNKSEWSEITIIMDQIFSLISEKPYRKLDILIYENLIIDKTKIKLKSEWDRIKHGETGYRIFYWSAMAALIGIIFLILTLTWLYVVRSPAPAEIVI